LVAVTEAFANAASERQPRSIAVDVEACNDDGVVEILVRGYGGCHDEAAADPGSGLHLMHLLMDRRRGDDARGA
jgi:hypothetical protein